MLRCPACRARYKGELICVRCGTNLGLPLLSETQAMEYVQLAVRHLLNGNRGNAQIALKQALQLNNTPLALSLVQFIRQAPVKIDEPVIHRASNGD